MSKVVLGRGLEALIPVGSNEGESKGTILSLPLESIAPNPFQPRQTFDEEGLQELAASVKSHGLLQPILVKRDGTGYLLVAGERRFRAARMVGLEKVPALVMEDLSETDMLQIALIENLQRENLNPIEAANAYQMLMSRCGLTQTELADRVGKSRAAVANTLRLLSLPDKVKQLIIDGRLSEGHARAILSVSDPVMREKIAERISAEALSVRQAEEISRQGHRRRLTVKRKLPAIEDAETFLKHTLGTAVRIVPGLKKGVIQIEYYGNEDLSRLLDLFRKIA